MINKNNAAYLSIGDQMRYFLFFLITLFYLLISLIYPMNFRIVTYDICVLFIKVILPSIIPIYLISSIMTNNKYFIKLSHRLLKPFKLFESINAPALFISSILVGNPTTTIVTLEKYKNKDITFSDTKIILSSSFFNPLFIINSTKLAGLNKYYAYLFIICLILSNFIILCTNKKVTEQYNIIKTHFSIFELINSLPNLILNIFVISLVINYLKIPFILIEQLYSYIKVPIEFFDITTGFYNISNMNMNTNIKLTMLNALITANGLSILFQTLYFIKQKAPDNIRYFIKSLLINRVKLLIISSLLFCILAKLFF